MQSASNVISGSMRGARSARLLRGAVLWPRWRFRSAPAAPGPVRQGRGRCPTSRRRSSTTRASSCSTTGSDYKDARQEVRRGRAPAPVFGMGAQGAHHGGLRALRGEGLRRLDLGGAALRDAASGQPRRRLRAVPDRLVVLRADPRRQPRSGPDRKGDRRARRGVAQISGFANTPQNAKQQDRDRARPARRQGDGRSAATI